MYLFWFLSFFFPVEALAVGPCYKPTNITLKESASILKTNISTLLLEINSICVETLERARPRVRSLYE